MNKEMKIIDVDVHNDLKSHMDLVPYLPEPWKSRVASTGLGLVQHGYWTPVGVVREDCKPPSGGPAASDPDYLVQDLVEGYNMKYVILTSSIIHISSLHDPDYTAAVCSAYNDYLIAEWLPRHKSFKGAILVSTLDPNLAAKEIERLAGHPDIVEVLFSSGARSPLGQRQYHPIYEAAHRHNLPVAIHIGGEGAGGATAPTAAGYPSRYIEWHTNVSQTYMAHLVSMVTEGVFEKFPRLKFVMKEGGIAWLPHLMWRLDKNYKGLRYELPWLKRLPSEYIRDHCFFSTQPIEEPSNPKDLITLFDMIDAENFLLFSSDYPHWDNDVPTEILKRLGSEARQKIFHDNAQRLYRL
ncbi:amidohydrolase family protein [Paenibacillus alginolyticus]|uniref:Amidohydrolase n=1 Tax=Paenibacillus alginolyticus TaxID=59839 RepID=A0ABT4GPP3_9BACL|nr:amidohydrolase family protein [Paenibacillus alginolyticus]MCY9698176.1 amidohydrolase [Paenibacillus alginolyticus]MEC0146722.1 amidohydrolase family protein [Paenibacillus alginolyticus]